MVGQHIDWPQTALLFGTVSNVILAIITGIYAWLTNRLVKTSERQIREMYRPRLLIHVMPRASTFLVLCVENVGASAAEQIAIRLDRPVYPFMNGSTSQNLQEYPIFNGTLPSLAPNAPLHFALGTQYLNDKLDRSLHPLSFTATATYQFSGVAVTESFSIDINTQFHKVLLNHDYLSDFGKDFPQDFRRFSSDVIRAIQEIGTPIADDDIGGTVG